MLEAGLVTTGSINSVISGKAYNKALFCLKAVVEALERLLFETFLEDQGDMEEPAALISLLVSPGSEQLNDPAVNELVDSYKQYEEKVRQGKLEKTAVFWMSLIDQVHLLFMLQHSVKTNDLDLFHYCNGEMANLFFAFDGQNYAK